MADSYASDLKDIIDRTFTGELGGRATAEMLHDRIAGDLPEHLVEYLIGKGLRSQVRAYFRAKDRDGLPKRPEVNAEGEHAQLEFADVAEYAYVHSAFVDRAAANAAQAQKVRDRCIAVHGVDLALAKSA